MPIDSISAAAKGPDQPVEEDADRRAAEMVARSQPKFASSGSIITPGAERSPAETSSARKVTPATMAA